jgi:hypothetical protein
MVSRAATAYLHQHAGDGQQPAHRERTQCARQTQVEDERPNLLGRLSPENGQAVADPYVRAAGTQGQE